MPPQASTPSSRPTAAPSLNNACDAPAQAPRVAVGTVRAGWANIVGPLTILLDDTDEACREEQHEAPSMP